SSEPFRVYIEEIVLGEVSWGGGGWEARVCFLFFPFSSCTSQCFICFLRMFGEDRGCSHTSAAFFVCLFTFSRNGGSSYTLDCTIFVRLLGEPRKVEDCCNDGLALTPLFPMSLACSS
uniref:Uncharacterized protein n=1 Tax=Triticum urartu TaxID=4572 RepID=A0A8R7P779_TRIUA